MNSSQTMTNALPAKLKAERPMPKWVTEASERIGPKPPAPPPYTTNGATTPRPPALPPKKNQTEPDYEVIEFSGQQYSNETISRPKTPDTRRPGTAMKCTLCGSNNPWVTCDECAQQIFCASCDDMFHKHPKRKTHLRKAIELPRGSTPLIPPKAAPNPPPPVAPPRRNKKGMPSPMPLRRDQVFGSVATIPTTSPIPGQQAWQDRLGSLKRGLNLSSRPLPETPRTPSDGVSSRSTTPNSKSVFDTIQRPPSITLEKIKNKASATLDRMALLQQRYRQHKEAKANEKANGRMGRDQIIPSDQCSNISSPTHFRSGSMSSGINSFDFPDDSPFHFPQQMGLRNGPGGRNMSTSVFNLNQISQRPTDHHSHMWMGENQMQQAQSMAQLNCMSCNNHRGWNQPPRQDEWPGASNANLNRSNMSLNVPHGYYPSPHQQHMMHPPPVFMNMPGMYPYPMGMGIPVMNSGHMGMPSSARSRVASRANSRLPSPTLSRKSMQVRKKRSNYAENELTDDEDSDNDDRRSLMSQRSGMVNQRRGRRVSSASQSMALDEVAEPKSLRSKVLNSRDRRGPSVPKSVPSEWTHQRRPSTNSNANTNLNSYKKVYSDSPISPDSEASETPSTRALVQAKIQEKMKESTKPKPEHVPLPANDDENQDHDDKQKTNGHDQGDDQAKETASEDCASLGPPPSTPDHEWECEFCTFVNEAKIKICSICCKTPQRSPPKVTTTANKIAKLKVSQPEDDGTKEQMAAKKKDNASLDDIWTTLDENIQAEAIKAKLNAETSTPHKPTKIDKEKKVQKVSTGCGSSPPKEVTNKLRSTATSPVPQSIATQTYDCLEVRNEQPERETIATSTEMGNNDLQNQSYTPPSRNFSPRPMYPPTLDTASSMEAENFANLERNIKMYREMSVSQAERYRSSNDIRLDELPHAMPQNRPPTFDYLSTQKAQMYHNDTFFDHYAASKRNEPTRDPEIELFMMLKEAEHFKFTAEELHAALKHCGDVHPVIWLRENWSKLVQTVQSLATKYGQERIENVIGTISAIEAREALRMHGGNVWQAISECVEQRQRKYLEISAKGNFSREDIVTALTAHHGNVELALMDLSKTQLKPFLMRVWGSPGGVENESANYMLPPPNSEVSSPIHEFLSAHADQSTFTQDQSHFRKTSSIANLSNFGYESKDDNISQNKNALKDLEILIGNMEQVQAKQNGQVLKSIEDMLGNILAKKSVEAENEFEADRIFMKSPIITHRSIESVSNHATDIKSFVWQHIQEIVPNLVEQVEKELLESHVNEESEHPAPVDAGEFLMEEVIKPNLKLSLVEDILPFEMYEVSEMEDFTVVTDKASVKRQIEDLKLNSYSTAGKKIYKMGIAPESSEEESSEEESTSQDEALRKEAENNMTTYKDNAKFDTKNLETIVSSVKEEVKGEENSKSKDKQVTETNVQNPLTSNDKTTNETEGTHNKTWGFKGFSFRIGFNSLRRKRKHRMRRSLKKEKVDSENDEKDEKDHSNVAQPSSSGKKTEVILEPQPDEAPENKISPLFEARVENLQEPRTSSISTELSPQIQNSSESQQVENKLISAELSSDAAEESPEAFMKPQKVTKKRSRISLLKPKGKVGLSILEKQDKFDSTPSTSFMQKTEENVEDKRENQLDHSTLISILRKNDVKEKLPELEETKQEPSQKTEAVGDIKQEAGNYISSEKSPEKANEVLSLNSEKPLENGSVNNLFTAPKAQAQPVEKTVAPTALKKKVTSRIPVRRTISSSSLKSIESPTISSKADQSPPQFKEPSPEMDQKNQPTEEEEFFDDVQSSSDEEVDFFNVVEESISQINTASQKPPHTYLEEETSDQELFSVGSEEMNATSTRDLLQSQTSESEVLLILGNEQNFIPPSAPASSIRTVTPISNNSVDFKYSDPSKQNLSELVEDTQRLIKQMKEEINFDMAAFDSEDNYSEDYSYEEYEEEYEEEGDEDDVDHADCYEEEETENEDEYSNVELESGNDNEGSLKDVEEVDEADDADEANEAEYIDEEEMNTEDNNLAESMHVTSQEPSTNHSSLIDVELSNSQTSLTNQTHIPSTSHNSVSIVLGTPPSAFSQTEETNYELDLTKVEIMKLKTKELITTTGSSKQSLVEMKEHVKLKTLHEKPGRSKVETPPAEPQQMASAQESSVGMKEHVALKNLQEQHGRSEGETTHAEPQQMAREEIWVTNQTKCSKEAEVRVDENNEALKEDHEDSDQTIPQHTENVTSEIVNNNISTEKNEDNVEGHPSKQVKVSNQTSTPLPESSNIAAERDSEIEIAIRDTEIEEPMPPTTAIEMNEQISAESTPSISAPEVTQSVNIDVPSSSNSSQENTEKNRVFAGQIDIVLEQKPDEPDNMILDTTYPVQSGTEIQSPQPSPSHDVNTSKTQDQTNYTASSSSPLANDSAAWTPSTFLSGVKQHLYEKPHQTSNAQTYRETQNLSPFTPTTDPTDSVLQAVTNDDQPKTSQPNNVEKKQAEESDIPATSKATSPRKSPPKKSTSKIPKLTGNAVSTRSKSFSGPSPIGISSVRAIQQELFNKQVQLSNSSVVTQKPPPPTNVRKKSITDAISKFQNSIAEHAIQRSRTQPKIAKIPKKKYHETCFSDDDYQDTTSEEEAPSPKIEVRLRKQSAPVFRAYPSVQELQIEKPEDLARRLMNEQLVTNFAEAQLAAALVGMKFQQDVSIWAAKECSDLDQAISLLQQECELCMGLYPMNEIVSMLKCTHKCCKECAKNYFTIQITDRSINDCNCPFCKIPELHDPNIHEDENLEYFSNLDIFLKSIIEPDVHELFQRKLRDRTLVQDPNFKWCIQCSSGFFSRPKQKRLICPDCGSVTCSQCRKTWEKQHEGLSCEKFQEWKALNDPELQAKGVADHLAVNGIDCPKCRFRYSLARGGCMHFTCTQCKFEFCYGCSRPFMMGAKCNISPYCSKLGLHSHHPRSCLFYLRDKNPLQLQNLLWQNNVSFDVDPVASDGVKFTSKCPIPMQKETPTGLIDAVCNADVQKNHAGLCRQHYVEYLAGKVSKAGIDPLPILDLTDCVQELRRRGLPLPERGPWDTDDIYRNMCSKVIKENIPLE